MKKLYLFIFSLLSFLNSSFSQPSNTFTIGDEGWTAACEGVGPAPAANWVAINGNPYGCFKGTDNGSGTWYYNSSSIYNTDMSAYYSYYLNFDLKQNSNTSQTNEPDVIICKADGSKIVYSTPFNPGTTWTSYTVLLSEAGWKYNTLAGAAVTYADMISYLSNVYYIKIRGDYSSITTETSWLDNVKIIPSVMLPVELVSFNGIVTESGTVNLEWETYSETNCSYFQIEKSLNSGMSFDSIGLISANGTSTASHFYQFTDDHFSYGAYYRLKSVDFDNSADYSQAIFVESNQMIPPVKIYPNPSSGDFIQIAFPEISNFSSVRVMDQFQNKVLPDQKLSNANALQINIRNLPAGMYYLSLVNAENISTYPFQIIR